MTLLIKLIKSWVAAKITCITEEKKSYEGILVEDEADYALKQIKNGSAPSNDGITVEVLNVFWSFIGETVLLAFSSAFANGQYCLHKEKQ